MEQGGGQPQQRQNVLLAGLLRTREQGKSLFPAKTDSMRKRHGTMRLSTFHHLPLGDMEREQGRNQQRERPSPGVGDIVQSHGSRSWRNRSSQGGSASSFRDQTSPRREAGLPRPRTGDTLSGKPADENAPPKPHYASVSRDMAWQRGHLRPGKDKINTCTTPRTRTNHPQ